MIGVSGRTVYGLRQAAPIWQRTVDCILAGLALLLLSPALVAFALVIRLLSGRSPLVAHLRVGYNGEALWMLKFRTMWTAAVAGKNESGWVQPVIAAEQRTRKPRQDPRVTSRFASWCRAYSIDELPQLWHILRGEMSLVGPRPLTYPELEQHYPKCTGLVLSHLPGLTGLWQVKGRNKLTYPQRRRLDCFLVKHYSPALYARILVATLPQVLKRRGAW